MPGIVLQILKLVCCLMEILYVSFCVLKHTREELVCSDLLLHAHLLVWPTGINNVYIVFLVPNLFTFKLI